MEIAITGASGFVGAALVRSHLERGDSVRVLVRNLGAAVCRVPSVRAFQGDLAIAGAVPEDFVAHADVLYHCAAELRDGRRMEAVNIEGARALARLAAGRIGRWVQVSSASVYGAVRSGTVSEDSPLQPDSRYGRTKAEAETVIRAAGAAGGYGVTIVRPSNVFGPGMPGASLFKLFAMIERGLFCFVGKPRAMMNYVHVDNIVAALVRCGTHERAAGRTYNLSDQMPIENMVAIIADEIGVRRPRLRLPEPPLRVLASAFGWVPGVPLTHRNLDALTRHASYASDRIWQELAYNSVVSLEAGLRELVRRWKRGR